MAVTISASNAAAYSTLTAKPINYGVAQLSWNAITDTKLYSINKTVNNTYPSFTLVRKVSGYPQGITDGEVLRVVDNYYPTATVYTHFGTNANYFVFDTGSAVSFEGAPPKMIGTKYQGTKIYYALFLTYPDTGATPFRAKKIAETSVVFVENNNTLSTMLDLLPKIYTKNSNGTNNQDLENFLSLFAFYYDLYRTQSKEVFYSTNVAYSDETFIKLLLKQFGVSYGDIQDLSIARTVLKNVIYLYQTSGSKEGIVEFVKAYTGYGSTAVIGKNLIHNYNASSFEESTDAWYPVVDAVSAPYGKAYSSGATRASTLSKVGPVATGTSTIAAFNNQAGVALSSATGGIGDTEITVASTLGLIPGSAVTGHANLAIGTIITSVDTETKFTINAPLTGNIVSSTLATSSNMVTGMMKFTSVNNGDAAFSLRPKIIKVDTNASINAVTLSVAPAIAAVNDYVFGTGIPYGTYITAIDATNSDITLSKSITSAILADAELWVSSSSFDKIGASTQFLPISKVNEPHTFSFYLNRAGNTARDITVSLRWRSVDGSVIATGGVTATVTSGSQTGGTVWYRAVVTGLAPTGAAYCEPIITVVSSISGDIYFFDCVQWQYGIKVYSAGIASNVVTVTTTEAHGFASASQVEVSLGTSYDGAFTITSTPSPTTFTYSKVVADDYYTIVGAYSVGQIVYIPPTALINIPIGSIVTVSSGTGGFAASTTVLERLNTQAIYVSAVPTTALSNATIKFSQKTANQINSTIVGKVSSVITFEDARRVTVNVLAQSVNEITKIDNWHSSSGSTAFSSADATNLITGVKTAGSISFPFSGGSGPFNAITGIFDKSIQIINASGSGNTITYTADGNHEFIIGDTPKVFNMKNFYTLDSANQGRGNGFDIKAVNLATVPITSTTLTTFTVTKAPIVLTGVNSGTSSITGSPYIEVGSSNYDQLWVGAKVVVTGGAGNLSTATASSDPIITSIAKIEYNSSTSRYDRFYLDYPPKVTLVNASITASLGSGTLVLTNFDTSLPTAVSSYSISYAKGRNVYYNNSSSDYGTFKGMSIINGLSYTFALKKSHTNSLGYDNYSPDLGNYKYYGLMSLPYVSFTNGVSTDTKIPMASIIKSILRSNNITTFTTFGFHNFKIGDLIYLSNVRVTPPGGSQINYSNDSVSGTTSGVPYYVSSVTPTSFSARHFYRANLATAPTYDRDGNDFIDTLIDRVAFGTGYYPALAGYAITERAERYLSMTTYAPETPSVLQWDIDNLNWKYAIPGFYIVELFGTPSSVSTHTATVTSTLFSASTEFKNYFDGTTDPNNRVGGFLDTLWEGTPGESRSHFYLNLASVSARLKRLLPNAIPYANQNIGYPNTAAKLSSAVVNSAGTQITYTASSVHNLTLDSMVSVTGFTGNTAANVIAGEIINIVSPTKFIVAPKNAISNAGVTGTGTVYATNGWINLYQLKYADSNYGAPFSYGYGVRSNIFTLDSSLLDGTDTLN